ncbi:MAG: RES domain-containing protein, partial [Acetobacteraceae bacterium]
MPSRRVNWREAWRVVASRYPPIALFERLAPDPSVSEALAALEQLTDPRMRDEVGEIALVPPGERLSGPGAGFVMVAFTHPNPRGSRFSDGTFGVYYAAAALETAIAETAHHFAIIARDSADPPRGEDMRALVGAVAADFADVAALPAAERAAILDPDSYAAGRAYGTA